jgi:LmbE family N-acetylglucosaminyl deacetylase
VLRRPSPFDIKATAAPQYSRVIMQRQAAERRAGKRDEAPDPLTGGVMFSLSDGIGRARSVNDGDGFMFISHTGEIMPSGFLPLPAGNVRRDDLVQIYRESPLFLSLRDRRVDELTASASVIGCARVVLLGYGDSGLDGTANPDRRPFAHADVEEAAHRLAEVLREEGADVLTTYDPAGGYGHPDHVQVHRVGVRAAEIASTPVVLEATADRAVLQRVVRLLRAIRFLLPGLYIPPADAAYTARAEITHRVDIAATLGVKRAAIAAHASQSTAPSGVRTLGLILRLPRPLFRWGFRREWFVERGRVPSSPPIGDIFDTFRDDAAPDHA